MIAAARKPQAIRLLSMGAATTRLAWRLGEGAAIAALAYLLVITVLEVTAIAARMQ
jgi:hypothetical protein